MQSLTVDDIARKLLERWKTVMSQGQQAQDAKNQAEVRIYRQERQFLEELINQLNNQLETPLLEWESYQQNSPPNTYFSPDSTDVEPHF